MDGVVIDSEKFHGKCGRAICKRHGLAVPPHEWETFKGKRARVIFSLIVERHGNGRFYDVEELIKEWRREFLRGAKGSIQLVDGAVGFLSFAQRRFAGTALVTSAGKEIQTYMFEIFGLHRYFDEVVTGDDVVETKPDPEPYLAAAERLKVSPRELLVVEDSKNGIISAREARCVVVGITTSHPREELLRYGAHYTVDSFHKLRRFF
jgi:beta-phosphoglucomutase-like phosphatase (HAD superfamily)